VTDADRPDPLRLFLDRHMPTMDHVTLLLAIRANTSHTPATLAKTTGLRHEVVDQVVHDLTASELVRADENGLRLTSSESVREVVALLEEAYRTRPVTLIRAFYARSGRRDRSLPN